jgi:hypothetical protein
MLSLVTLEFAVSKFFQLVTLMNSYSGDFSTSQFSGEWICPPNPEDTNPYYFFVYVSKFEQINSLVYLLQSIDFKRVLVKVSIV